MPRLSWMIFAMALSVGLSSCASGSGARLPPPPLCPQPPPAPAAVMQPRPPSFLQRMRSFLYDSPPKPTTSPGS